MTRALRSALGLALGIFVRVYLATLRVSVTVHPELDRLDPQPWILCFWHGEQLPLLCWRRRRPTVALVSLSADGQMQAKALGRQGLLVERGSTSRGGAKGLLSLVRRLRGGEDAAIAIDGPKGPRFSVAPGAPAAARLSGGLLIPMASAAPRGVTLRGTWDQFRIPAPFSRVYVRLGAPLLGGASTEDLGRAVAEASRLASSDRHMLGSAERCGITSRSARVKFRSR